MNKIRNTLLLLILVPAAGFSAPAQAENAPAPAVGRIINLNGSPGLEDAEGKRWTIEGEAAICFKYADLRVEVLDPAFTTAGSVRFSRYRILESEKGGALSAAPVRQILSTRHRQPVLTLRVTQTGPELRFSMTLSNPNRTPVKLKFPSTQMYDFVVMSTDEKTTLWRWSWGASFEVGFKELEIRPRGEARWEAAWDFTRSYVQDGEYIAFGEVHCLPHGILSEVQRVVLQANKPRVVLPQYFLPLESNTAWTYRTLGASPRNQEMKITGTIRLEGKEYSVFSFFPDEKSLAPDGFPQTGGNSRVIRFDRDHARFMEWTPLGEKPLLAQDGMHRFVPVEGGCRTEVGNFDRAVAFQVQRGDTWKTLLTVVPGIGIVRAAIPRPGGGELELEMISGRSASTSPSPSAPAAAASSSPVSAAVPAASPAPSAGTPAAAEKRAEEAPLEVFTILMRKSGGFPPEESLVSLSSDGNLAVVDKGVIVRQAVLSPSTLWHVAQTLEREGFFQLSDSYGKDDITDPLVIELTGEMSGRKKHIVMRTSAEQKPPMSFWRIVDAIEYVVKRGR